MGKMWSELPRVNVSLTCPTCPWSQFKLPVTSSLRPGEPCGYCKAAVLPVQSARPLFDVGVQFDRCRQWHFVVAFAVWYQTLDVMFCHSAWNNHPPSYLGIVYTRHPWAAAMVVQLCRTLFLYYKDQRNQGGWHHFPHSSIKYIRDFLDMFTCSQHATANLIRWNRRFVLSSGQALTLWSSSSHVSPCHCHMMAQWACGDPAVTLGLMHA